MCKRPRKSFWRGEGKGVPEMEVKGFGWVHRGRPEMSVKDLRYWYEGLLVGVEVLRWV